VLRTAASVVLALAAVAASAGPVEVYREGPRHCPRDRAPTAERLDPAQAVARARALLPDGFCGPSRFVAGCDASAELEYGTWRVYLHQYRQRADAGDWLGLDHTYVILDGVGNCIANIPGTPLGSFN
jgi:hypothetical protein